jgi:hypothetical protein
MFGFEQLHGNGIPKSWENETDKNTYGEDFDVLENFWIPGYEN